jgi:hypothetical protein
MVKVSFTRLTLPTLKIKPPRFYPRGLFGYVMVLKPDSPDYFPQQTFRYTQKTWLWLFCFLFKIAHDLAGRFVLPVTALLERPIEGDGALRAIINAASAVPAFIRMQDYRRLAFFRVGDKDIYLADLHAGVAAIALFSIINNRVAGADGIR